MKSKVRNIQETINKDRRSQKITSLNRDLKAIGQRQQSEKANIRRKERHQHQNIEAQKVAKSKSEKTQNSRSIAFYLLPSFRLFVVWGVMILGTLGLAANLYRLQVLEAQTLQKKARSQQTMNLRPFVPRRPIVDRQGNVLATDRPLYTLYAHPKLFKISKQEMAVKLSPILVRTHEELIKQFDQGKSGLTISKMVTEDQAQLIGKLHTDGLELIPYYSRIYPQQELAAEVVGYVDGEHRGQAGVEYSQQSLLERALRNVRVSRLGNGVLMPDQIPEGFLHLDDLQLQLTLDSRMQRATRAALKTQMKKFNAKRGTVIIMDVHDGSILTMVSEPSYDPNKYSKSNVGLFKNWAISDLYEPGSTFKPLNVAIALETGVIKPDSSFYDGGLITVSGWPIRNAEEGTLGQLDIAQILQYSSNVGMVQIIQKMKPDLYYSWLERLGISQTVGIDLPFEAQGHLKNKKQFINSPIEPATTSFGQGVSLTPIHLVQMQAALANGGKLVTPHVIRGLSDAQGQMYWQPTLPAPRQIFSPNIADSVLKMMETVVTKGTGKPAQIQGYRIGGKTGTAQKASSTGGYHSSAKITSFVGILPVESPRYVVLAVVDEPHGSVVFGSTVAAPIVKSVMESLITIEGIAPSSDMTPPIDPKKLKAAIKKKQT